MTRDFDEFGKITRITLKGFRSIKSVENLELNALNVVVGANGAGKSNFIGFFRLLNRIAHGELQLYVTQQGGVEKVLHFGSKHTHALSFDIRSDANRYEADLVPTQDGGLAFADEAVWFSTTRKSISVPNQRETQLRTTNRAGRIPPFVYNALEDWKVFHFHDTGASSPLKGLSRVDDCERLAADGGNIAAFLLYLSESDPETFEKIETTVRRVAPFFQRFLLRPDPRVPDKVRLRWRHKGIEEPFDASDLSDGTLRFIALATLFLQPHPPSTIILDEPELGLHPFALQLLAGLMDSVCHRTQIICATQSVTFLDQFSWEDIIVADRVEDATHLRRLTETEVQAWIGEFSVGDLWARNIIGGRPG